MTLDSNPENSPEKMDDVVVKNPSGISFWKLIGEDFSTHRRDPLSQGFWAISVHRFGVAFKSVKFKPLRIFLAFIYKLVNRFVEWCTGITILHTTSVGRRVHIWHHSGIIINAKSIGNEVVIRQNTTFGERYSGSLLPVIENNVDIGCGAVILGGIVVGEHSSIGANSVVLHDVPPRVAVAGIPAQILKKVLPDPFKS